MLMCRKLCYTLGRRVFSDSGRRILSLACGNVFFGSKTLLRSFRGAFLGGFCMDFFHALGSAVLAVTDLDKMLLILRFVHVNEIRKCAFCDGNK